MEKQTITKAKFQKLLTSIGDETYEIVLEGLNWYEQLTDGETVYQYKLMSLQEQKFSDFWDKAKFPDKLFSGVRCMPMPILMGTPSSIILSLKRYWKVKSERQERW